MKDSNAFKWIIGSTLFILLVLCCAKATQYVGPVQRFSKKMESELGGGLQRVVTLYDNNGNVIKKWYGKIDLSDTTEIIDFIVDGRRVIIKGGIVVTEEER